MPHLFTRFERTQGTRARTQEGSGIGLALVHELVRIHGGTVTVVSQPGKGTAFTVRVPRGRAHLPEDRIRAVYAPLPAALGAAPFVEEALRWLPEAAAPPQASSIDGTESAFEPADVDDSMPRVLVADDHADMRKYLNRLLGRRWKVEAVGDGHAALEAIHTRPPDLVIADVMMPGLDGFGLLRELRSDPRTSMIPVLLLSGRGGEGSRVMGLSAGAADYLMKPFSGRELVATVQNHLERARLRAQADFERARLRSLFNEAPVPICIFRGPDHLYEFANPPYARLIGNRDLIGKTAREALPETEGQEVIEALDVVYRTGERFWGLEMPVRPTTRERDCAPGEECYFNLVYQALRTPSGEIDGVMVFALDVTDQVLARRKIEEHMQARDAFFAAASHELRNPIHALQVQLLNTLRAAEREVAPPALEWIQARVGRATSELSRLIRLLDTLLDVSRMASGRLPLTLEDVNLADVVADVIDRLDPADQAQITTRTLNPAVGRWDRMRLDQVVTNLVSNALKYGRGHPIAIAVTGDGHGTRLEVADRGIGIASEHQERIFERFERAVADRRYKGFGLGLWITSRIVEALGGSMSLHSALGEGSTFIVELPNRPADRAQSVTPGSAG